MNDLNELLARAKAAAIAFEPYVGTTEGEEWKPFYRQRREAIGSLYNAMYAAIDEGKTIIFTLDGKENLIGTIGILSDVSFMRYESSPNARYTMQGVNLLAVEALEALVKDDLRLKVAAKQDQTL